MKMLGDRIRELRLAKGMSQAQLARKLHVTQGAVSQWEKGLTRPDFDLLNALETVLGTNLSYLVGSTDDASARPTIDQLSAEYEAELEREMLAWSLGDDDRRNPDRRLLFLLAKHGSDGDVRLAAALVKALQDNNPHFYRPK